MNEWMCIYIPHISHDVSWWFTMLLSEIERQLVKAPLLSVHFWSDTHPAHAWNVRQTTTPGTSSPTLSDKCVASITSPANHVTPKMQETRPTVYSPYPRRLQCLTICRYNYKGNTFPSVILRPWVLVRPSTSRTADWRSINWANQAADSMNIALFKWCW